jgi:photosystem I subunit 2
MASTMIAGSSVLAQTQRSSLAGAALRQQAARPCLRPARQVVRAEAETKEKEKKEEKKPFSPPALDSSWPSPIFGGSTGGLMRKAQEEEFYCITWEAKKEVVFELPTGGAAIMRQGPNLLKLARKEQCLALLTQLRTKFKLNGQFYRVFPNGEVQYLHPKDGVYPEKVNAGRQAVNANKGRIGENLNPVQIKFSGKLGTYDK